MENQSSVFCRIAAEDSSIKFNPCAALQNSGSILLSEKNDKKLYSEFISGLGLSDIENQMNHIKLYEALVSQHLQEACDDYIRRSKLYVSLGLFGGITLSMLIL